MKQGYEAFASVLTAFLLASGTVGTVQADNVLVADGPTQNKESIAQVYSTSTSQPAMLAIHGGTILSISELVTILPPGGMTGLEAEDNGSRITAENPAILGLGPGQTGISAVSAVNEGSVTLDGGRIGIAGGSSVGLSADNGSITVKTHWRSL